jgi:DNA topoisomerase-2
LVPWYSGFTGKIELLKREKSILNNKKNEEEENEENSEEKLEPDEIGYTDSGLVMVTTGRFEVSGKKVIVSELPIGRSMHKYAKFLEFLRSEKIISDFNNISTDEIPHFEIFGLENPTIEKLRLRRTFGLTNMVLLNPSSSPIKFDSISNVIEKWYEFRLPYYSARKEHVLSKKKSEISILHEKIQFIRAILSKKIRIKNRKKSEIFSIMEEMNISTKLLSSTNLANITEDEISSLLQDIQKKEEEISILEKTDPKTLWLNDLSNFEKELQKRK